MLMCGVALSLSAPQLCCCKLRCCGESWPWPHRTLSAGSKLGSYLTSCRLPPSYQQRRALESSSSSAESWEQRSRLWKWATKLSTDHSDEACGVMTSCLTTFQPFLLRTDGDNNSHDLAIFQPSPKCGTKLPTILRVQLQNCQVRAAMNLMGLLLPAASWGNRIVFQVNQESPSGRAWVQILIVS